MAKSATLKAEDSYKDDPQFFILGFYLSNLLFWNTGYSRYGIAGFRLE